MSAGPVQSDSGRPRLLFLGACLYIVLNPVRAAMVKRPRLWAWSSYGATMGTSPTPLWLTTDGLLAEFGKRSAGARRKYQQFIEEGMSRERIWKDLKGQIYLGDDDFIERMQRKLGERDEDVNIPTVQQRGPAPKLSVIRRQHKTRDDAIRAVYETGAYSYQQIAKEFGVHFTTVRQPMNWNTRSEWDDWARLSQGTYILRSNIRDWSEEEPWKTYVQLSEAEAAFRVQKSDLCIRPIWHRKQARIKAHVLICFLAYALWKTLQKWQSRAGLGDSPRTIIAELSRIHSADIVLPLADGSKREIRLRCVVRPDREQALLLQRLGLTLPQRLNPLPSAQM